MEIEQQDPLVTYRRPRLLPGEQVLTFLMYAFIVIFGAAALVMGFLVVVIWGNFLDGTVGTASYRNTVGNIVFVLTIVAMASVVIAFLLERLASHFYDEVPQGKIITVTMTMTLGGENPIYKEVKLKGNNRMNQERTQTHKIKGDRRSREYRPGQYIDFS